MREGSKTSTGESWAEEKNVGNGIRNTTRRAQSLRGAGHQVRMRKVRVAYT